MILAGDELWYGHDTNLYRLEYKNPSPYINANLKNYSQLHAII